MKSLNHARPNLFMKGTLQKGGARSFCHQPLVSSKTSPSLIPHFNIVIGALNAVVAANRLA